MKNVSVEQNVLNFAPMDEKKKEIIHKALEVYMRFGIKSVTMDEMARQLGISKKTLYLHVKDKNDLVEQCIIYAHEGEVCAIAEINSKQLDAIEEILEVSRYVIQQLKAIHPSIFFDLSRYHPKALGLMHKHKFDVVYGCVKDNLEKGLKQKLYRENLNVEIMARIYLTSIDNMMVEDQVLSSKYRMDEVYSEFFRYHIRGIASKKGLKRLTELIENDENL
ncbi:MAG: TetR/AcrR family transcriptional regulator [Flavobacteriales bacterium]|jgi:AcrR family transcriptional regulator|nr:TetR/AcrR family transcriptional regulator [Flavobacteriales bacterium]